MDNHTNEVKVYWWLKKHSLGEKPCCDNCKFYHHENGDTCGETGMLCGSWEESEEEQLKLF